MEYSSDINLSLDEEFILVDKILPTAKRWVMDWPSGDPLHEHGLSILKFWNVRDPELRRRMSTISEQKRPLQRAGIEV